MNIIEYVKLTGDTNYVPVKYAVMEVTVGVAAASTYVWLKLVSYGVDTEGNYNTYVDSIKDATFSGMVPAGLVGVLRTYSVVALSTVESYTSKYSNHEGPYNIG